MEAGLQHIKFSFLGSQRTPLPSQRHKIPGALFSQLHSPGSLPTLFSPSSRRREGCVMGFHCRLYRNPCVRHWSCLMSYSFRCYTCWVQIEGTIVAPDEPKNWDPKNPRIWLDFFNLTGVLFQGGGVIDGSGSKWWAASCKRNKSNVMFFFFFLDYSCM